MGLLEFATATTSRAATTATGSLDFSLVFLLLQWVRAVETEFLNGGTGLGIAFESRGGFGMPFCLYI
jgi:hypothetical protein